MFLSVLSSPDEFLLLDNADILVGNTQILLIPNHEPNILTSSSINDGSGMDCKNTQHFNYSEQRIKAYQMNEIN